MLCLVVAALLPSEEIIQKLAPGQAEQAAIHRVPPARSAIAAQLKVTGTVDIEVVISEKGEPAEVRPVAGNPILTQQAVAAVRQWKFQPFSLNGEPVKAVGIIRFRFGH